MTHVRLGLSVMSLAMGPVLILGAWDGFWNSFSMGGIMPSSTLVQGEKLGPASSWSMLCSLPWEAFPFLRSGWGRGKRKWVKGREESRQGKLWFVCKLNKKLIKNLVGICRYVLLSALVRAAFNVYSKLVKMMQINDFQCSGMNRSLILTSVHTRLKTL